MIEWTNGAIITKISNPFTTGPLAASVFLIACVAALLGLVMLARLAWDVAAR